MPEKQRPDGGRNVCDLPLKPLIDNRALLEIGRIVGFRSVFRREIGQDGVAFPYHAVAGDENRNHCVRVKSQKLRRVGWLEPAAVIQALIWNSNIFEKEKYLAHIPRRWTPINSDHSSSQARPVDY